MEVQSGERLHTSLHIITTRYQCLNIVATLFPPVSFKTSNEILHSRRYNQLAEEVYSINSLTNALIINQLVNKSGEINPRVN